MPSGFLNYEQLPGGQLTSEQINELLHMRHFGWTWTTHGPWSDNTVAMAGRIAQLADAGRLGVERPGMVLTGGPEESEALTARLQDFLPDLLIRNLTIDDRLSPGRSTASRAAVTEEAAVRVISYRMFRVAQQSFSKAGGAVVFFEQADRLGDGGQDHGFAKQLAHAAASVQLFTTTGFRDNPVTTFYLGALLGLPDFPRTLQEFKATFVRSTGYGMNEVMAWRESAMTDLAETLELHHHNREKGRSAQAIQRNMRPAIGLKNCAQSEAALP
jgi:hypothetical protein